MSTITARLAPIEGASQSAAPRTQRKNGVGLVVVILLSWGRWIAGLTYQSTDNAYLRADTTPISAQVNGQLMVLTTEDVALLEIPWIASLVHIVRTVGWQRIGTLLQILSSRFLEADVAARATTALIVCTLQRKAFVLAYRDAFLLLGITMLVSILGALCSARPCSPESCSNSLIERGPSMRIRTPSIVDNGRIRPTLADDLQGE
jgi:hypothetical protein